ncbi:MAG: EexN family lipoprotein [Woeseia sp.]|nr:EexN family lipoprotein [Woeseia sp.]MBT8095916.1 EexN family lipoprotein [Woeseia sp.]NNL54867.1 EexN family lipoprotein [Woeseia sp.]
MAFRPHRYFLLFAGTCLAVSCTQEQPHSVSELMDNPRLLEATVVRCAANRAELKYTEQCVNAREASDRLAVRENEANRKELEAESERKRDALRRSREAAVEARRRAEEAERLRQESDYLSQFEALPPSEQRVDPPPVTPTSPAATPDAASDEPELPAAAEDASLDDVREELRRRQQAQEQ